MNKSDQIIAELLRRLGGEAIITAEQLRAVRACTLSRAGGYRDDQVFLRLNEPEEPPQVIDGECWVVR